MTSALRRAPRCERRIALDPHIKISLYPYHMSSRAPRSSARWPTRRGCASSRLLRAMELSVGELAQVLGQSQPRVSRHVKILIDAGLAERRKEGSWVFLSLGRARAGRAAVRAARPLGRARRRRSPGSAADAARLAAVRADRAAAAERYFAAPCRRLGRAALAPRRRERGRGRDRPRARRARRSAGWSTSAPAPAG